MFDADFWSDVFATVIGAGVGAFLAFELERRRRKEEQRRDEIGRCHQLICLLVNRLNVLQDFHEGLFIEVENKKKRQRAWYKVGAFVGAPRRADEIPFGDYKFLIDGRAHQSQAPKLLRGVHRSTNNVNATLERIDHRNQLWYERDVLQSQLTTQVGADGAGARMRLMQIERNLAELTEWLRTDFVEDIGELNGLIDLYYVVMHEHYPDEKVLTFRSIEGGSPLGQAGGAGLPPNS